MVCRTGTARDSLLSAGFSLTILEADMQSRVLVWAVSEPGFFWLADSTLH